MRDNLLLVSFIIQVALVVALFRFTKMMHSILQELRESVTIAQLNQKVIQATVTRMEGATVVVAANLADSISRADATVGPEGAAADAALRTGDDANSIHARQHDGLEDK